MSRDKFANERWEWRDGERSNTESTQMLIGNSGCIVYHNAAWAVSDEHANLIAAAPDMYKKGQFKRNVIIHDNPEFEGEWIAIPREDFDAFKAAIAKARGESDNS